MTLKLSTITASENTIPQLYSGINFNQMFIGCEPQFILLGLKIMNNRLYFSTVIKDLNGDLVATINYNEWTIYTAHQIEWEPTDTSLSIKDHGGDYIIRMKFENSNTLQLYGYFVGIRNVMVLGKAFSCFTIQTQKDSAMEAIKTIAEVPF